MRRSNGPPSQVRAARADREAAPAVRVRKTRTTGLPRCGNLPTAGANPWFTSLQVTDRRLWQLSSYLVKEVKATRSTDVRLRFAGLQRAPGAIPGSPAPQPSGGSLTSSRGSG